MKKLIMLALPLVAFASCQVEELSSPETNTLPEKETVTYYASIEDDASTRTSSTSEGKILWSEGDKMNIFMGVNNDHKDALTLTAGAGTQNGSFVGPWIAFGEGMADKLHQTVTVYPFDENNTCVPNADKTAYTVGLTIPAEQYYAEGSFGNGAYPMIGVTENVKEIAFEVKNVAHVIYFKLKGENKKISKIVLSSENLALAGPAEVAVSYDSVPVATVTEATASNTVELICEGGVQLDPVTPTEFHVVIAPCTGVINVTIYDTEGGYTKRTLADQEFARGVRSPINHTYTGENSVIDDLKNAFKNGGEYTLPMDVTVSQGTALTLETGKTLNLNLNGNTLKLAHKTTGTQGSIHVGGGSLHISNGTIVGEAGNYLFGTNNIKSNDSIFEMTDVNVVREKTGAAIMVIGGGTNIEFNNVNVDAKCDIFFYSYGNVDPKLNGIVIDGGRYKTAAGKKIFNAVSNKIPVIFKGDCLFSEKESYPSENVKWVQSNDYWKPIALNDNNGEIAIDNVEQINLLAAKIDEGESFAGKTIKLTGNLDLAPAMVTRSAVASNWTPIGSKENAFEGTFDGQGFTVSNLQIYADEDWYVGFFGNTKNATIKNINLHNVDINIPGGLHMAALVGNAEGTTVIDNVKVTGDVNIHGDLDNKEVGRIGVIVGGNTGDFTISNVTIDVNEGSLVEGDNSIGGVAGQLQGSAKFENVVSNIDVRASRFFVGGVIGLAPQVSTFIDCSTSGDITLTAGTGANSPYRLGGIAGGWSDNKVAPVNFVNCSYTGTLTSGDVTSFDCEGFIGRGYATTVKVIIDGKEYIYQGNGVYYSVGAIIECNGVKGAIFEISDDAVKVVSVAELNLKGKNWQYAMDWAAGFGEGWALASMEDLNAIYDARVELNVALKNENADNALFWEGDELYIKNGSVYYALYMSSTEVPAGEADANGNEYFANRVFFKIFNKRGYSDVLYSAFDCINKSAPLRDNYFARATYTIAK